VGLEQPLSSPGESCLESVEQLGSEAASILGQV